VFGNFFLFLQVTNPSIPKVAGIFGEWQRITWSVVCIFIPIGALNNVDSGPFIWFAGLGAFLYFCSVNMCAYECFIAVFFAKIITFLHSPQFIRNYSSIMNPPAEYTAVFMINISTLFLFALVFAFELFCVVRRRIVAFKRGEAEAMQLHPRLFSIYRYTNPRESVLDVRSILTVRMQAEALEGACGHPVFKRERIY